MLQAVFPRGQDGVQSRAFVHSDSDKGTDCSLSRFAVDTTLWGVADTPEGRAVIQWDLDRLDWLLGREKLKFNKGQCNVQHPGRINPTHCYRLWIGLLERSSAEKDLGVLVDKFNREILMCPCHQEGQWYPGVYSINRNTGSFIGIRGKTSLWGWQSSRADCPVMVVITAFGYYSLINMFLVRDLTVFLIGKIKCPFFLRLSYTKNT